ncbi:MAG: hypothetical protein ABR527_02315, partial [Gemmatimonadota bacterium]
MSKAFHLAFVLLLFSAATLAAQEPQVPADTMAAVPGDTVVPAPPGPEVPPAAPGPEVPLAPTPPDTTAAAPDTTDVAPPDTVEQPPAPADTTAPGATQHDWEFSLAAGARAPSSAGTVQVTDGDPDNRFVVEVTGLPPVDSLDQEGRDVSAYTVWVVPSKERVRESTLAGTLEVDASGTGRFEGTTSL